MKISESDGYFLLNSLILSLVGLVDLFLYLYTSFDSYRDTHIPLIYFTFFHRIPVRFASSFIKTSPHSHSLLFLCIFSAQLYTNSHRTVIHCTVCITHRETDIEEKSVGVLELNIRKQIKLEGNRICWLGVLLH